MNNTYSSDGTLKLNYTKYKLVARVLIGVVGGKAKVEANYGHGSLKVVMVRQLRRLSYPYKKEAGPIGPVHLVRTNSFVTNIKYIDS